MNSLVSYAIPNIIIRNNFMIDVPENKNLFEWIASRPEGPPKRIGVSCKKCRIELIRLKHYEICIKCGRTWAYI